ncbi:MAG: DegT/DnrJ/EryC1/StrS family aminotransferase [Clostridia bacterium]
MTASQEAHGRFAGHVRRKHAIAVNSGTSGLHLLVRAFGIGEGDEVITTPFSFIASSNCILYERAKPVFVDIEPDTANIDPALIEDAITPRTKAILPVDAFGQPARLDVIREIADRHGLVVIEDPCRGARGRDDRHRRRPDSASLPVLELSARWRVPQVFLAG